MPHSPATIRPWTTAELKALRQCAHLGAAAAAAELGRSVDSVKAAAARAGISLRRPGERRGLVLGQPRGVAISAAIRGDVVDGRISGEALAARLRIDAEAQVCPECGYRAVEVERSGLCRPCHLRRLTAAHLDELEILDCQRALWNSRQCLKRTRDRATQAEG